MGLLSNALNNLAGNIFGDIGGPATGSTNPILRKTAIDMQNESPIDKYLANDPFAFSSISYPRDLTSDMSNGHYMLFYINVQNKTKYKYTGADGKTKVGQTAKLIESTEQRGGGDPSKSTVTKSKTVYSEGGGSDDASYSAGLISRGAQGTILDNNGVDLAKGSRGTDSGLSSFHPTTTRISDSIAIYLPPNVQSNLAATYNGMATGMLGAAAKSGAAA